MDQPIQPRIMDRQARRAILLLAGSVMLMETGYGIVMPIFAKRLGELGAGVETLGYMAIAFAIGQLIMAPILGSLADRVGRRPVILTALAGVALANLGFLLVNSSSGYVLIRMAQGAVTAGLLPASISFVADAVPDTQRARWVGLLMGSYGAGFIFGPALGGFLYDQGGFAAPFTVSAILAAVGLLATLILVPETRRQISPDKEPAPAIDRKLPDPRTWFNVDFRILPLLVLDFLEVSIFAFVEPQLAVYAYQGLHYTSSQFGLIVSLYGLSFVAGQFGLGRLSDRFGRRPLIVLGFIFKIIFYLGLTLANEFWLLVLAGVFGGVGGALISPALSAAYLDLTRETNRSRVMGLKESAAAMGGILGPIGVVIASQWMPPLDIFRVAAGFTLVGVLLAFFALGCSRKNGAVRSGRPVRIGCYQRAAAD